MTTTNATAATGKPARGSIGELVRYFRRLGLLGFGGPVSNPLLIAATAAAGLIAYPILQPDRLMIK